jgi:uncharacterized membrane protein
MPTSEGSELGLTTRRIETLTDGIYAISMTLLVLNLTLPEVGTELTESVAVHNLLFGQGQKFFNYALSFILLALFWIIHHQQFHFIKRTDRTHLWINIFTLMFIVLIPFSTSLVGDYSSDTAAHLFFSANLFIIGLFNSLNWAYATKGYRLVDRRIDPERIAVGKRRGLVTPCVALLDMVVAVINPVFSSYIYLGIPIILSLSWFRYPKQ